MQEELVKHVFSNCTKQDVTCKFIDPQCDMCIRLVCSQCKFVVYNNSDLTSYMGLHLTSFMKKYLKKKDKDMNSPIKRKVSNKKLEKRIWHTRGESNNIILRAFLQNVNYSHLWFYFSLVSQNIFIIKNKMIGRKIY